MKYQVLFNPLSGNGRGAEQAHRLDSLMPQDELVYTDATKIGGYNEWLAPLTESDKVILCGGDGTINRFINEVDVETLRPELLYYATGSGNDFLNDLGKDSSSLPFPLAPYVKDLPTVTVDGKRMKFLNGIGYGLDGYCCEEGDRVRENSEKKVNYTAIAIRGLMYAYKRRNATVTVDGRKQSFRRVWMAPTMNGRFYGGGMMIAPAQDRLSDERSVSCVVVSRTGKLKTLIRFPKVFNGEFTDYADMVDTLCGHTIKVEFDRPTALQVDGETIVGVTSYEVCSPVVAPTAPQEEAIAV